MIVIVGSTFAEGEIPSLLLLKRKELTVPACLLRTTYLFNGLVTHCGQPPQLIYSSATICSQDFRTRARRQRHVSCSKNPGSQGDRAETSTLFPTTFYDCLQGTASPPLRCRVDGHRSMAQCLSSRAPHAPSMSATMPLSLDERLLRMGLFPSSAAISLVESPPAIMPVKVSPTSSYVPAGYIDRCVSS